MKTSDFNTVKVFRKGRLYVTVEIWWNNHETGVCRWYSLPGAKDLKRNVTLFVEFFTLNHHLFKGIPE